VDQENNLVDRRNNDRDGYFKAYRHDYIRTVQDMVNHTSGQETPIRELER